MNAVYINKRFNEHFFYLIKYFYSSLVLFATISDFYNTLDICMKCLYM